MFMDDFYWPQTQTKATPYSAGIPLAMSSGLSWGSSPLSCVADGYSFGQRNVTDSSLTLEKVFTHEACGWRRP